MAALLNWERWQDWTDLQNAKLLAVTDGKGNLGDSDIRTLIRFIRCSKSELYERLERLKGTHYQFPLQRWTGSYVQFKLHKSAIEDNLDDLIQDVIESVRKVTVDDSDVIGVDIKYKYYISNHVAIKNDGILKALMRRNVMQTIYSAARSFVADNRDKNELKLFYKLFPNELPRDCFINLYPIGQSAGLNNHRDQSSFCSLVYCLLGDGSNLILIKETGDMEEINLKTNDMIVFSRIDHFVPSVYRKQNRITVNAFF